MLPPRIEVPDHVPPGPGLSPVMRAEALALAEAIFSSHDGPPPQERLTWMADELDDFVARSGARARASFFLCLSSVSRLAPLAIRRVGPLAALPLAERREALERFERTPLALAFFGAKAILCILYYEHPDAARQIGFDGACLRSNP